MKKIISLLLVVLMISSLAACGKENRYTSSDIPKEGEATDFSSYVTPVETSITPSVTSTPVVTETPVPTPTATPVATATPTATPIATTVITSSGIVTVTKSPTSETVDAGGSCCFVAYANNFTSIQWIIASSDSSTIYDASAAPTYFPGLVVTGQGSSTLKLSSIPQSLNGWKVQAVFSGTGGPVYTNVAYINVTATDEEQIASKKYAADVRNLIAAEAHNSYGFTTGSITNLDYYSKVSDFQLTFTKDSWTVYAEFISDHINSGYYPLAATVYNGSTVDSSYVLSQQTMSSFYDLLSQLN